MGMNNSDFLSDAVALDLGKSGVKVAETLEIEVGSEWWRLINAASVTEGIVFNKRAPVPPVIIGDDLILSAFPKERIAINHGLSWPVSKIFAAQYGPEVTNVRFFFAQGSSEQNTSHYKIYLHIIDNEVTPPTVIRKELSSTSSALSPYISVWDAINKRIITAFYIAGYKTYAHSIIDGSQITYSTTTLSFSSGWAGLDTFVENPGPIYSYYVVSGALSIKKVTPTTNENVATLVNRIRSSSSAVAVASNVSGRIFGFFMRSKNSVGVAWIDSTDGLIKYALESESWLTIRSLPNIIPTGASLTGFGVVSLPNEGEFFFAQFNKGTAGTFTLPAGYSFPANMSFAGFTRCASHLMRGFGVVGSICYSFTLDTRTNVLTYNGEASTAWTLESRPPVKVGESGNRELYVFHAHNDSGIAVYDTSTHTFVWQWIDWQNGTLFPDSYYRGNGNYNRSSGIYRMGNNMYIYQSNYRYASDMYLENYHPLISSILNCDTAVEFQSMLIAGGRVSSNLQYYRPPGASSNDFLNWPRMPSNPSCVLKVGEDFDFYYIWAIERFGSTNSKRSQIRIAKNTFTTSSENNDIVAMRTSYSVASTQVNYNVIPAIGAQAIDPNDSFRYLMDFSNEQYDPYWRTWGSTFSLTSTINDRTTGFTDLDGVLRFGGVHLPMYSAYTSYQGELPVTGLKGEAFAYITTIGATSFYIAGMSNTSELNCGGGLVSLTLPFIPLRHMAIDERDNVAYVLGAPSGNDFPYYQLNGISGMHYGIYGVKVSNNAVYNVHTGHTIAGGFEMFSPCGSYLLYKTVSGMVYSMPTGVLWNEGFDEGASESAGEAVSYYYEGRSFIPYPFAREGIRAELSNISKTTKITLPETQDNLIRGMLAAGTDFRGSRCILRRVFPDHLDEVGSDIVLLDGYIQDWSYVPGKKGIAFSVSKTLIDVGAQFPKRLMNMGCSHVFKGERCQYLGEEGRCLKTRAFCTSLGNINQFGGFPWVAARQRRVMWK